MALSSDFLNLIRIKSIKAVEVISSRIMEDTKGSFLASKSGIKYKRLPNRSSAIGETPAYQTGELYRSIKNDITITPMYVESVISANTPYSKYLVNKKRPILTYGLSKNRLSMFIRGIVPVRGT